MKRLSLVAFLAAFAVLPAFAAPAAAPKPSCPPPSAYSVAGPERAKAGVAQEYTFKWPDASSSGQVAFAVWRDGKRIVASAGDKFPYVFAEPGSYKVAVAAKSPAGCVASPSADVRVFSKFVAYVGEGREGLELDFETKFAERSQRFQKFLVKDDLPGSSERFLQALNDGGDFLKQADRIVMDVPDVASAFQALAKWAKARDVDLSRKELLVVSSTSENFLNRILAANARSAGISKVSVVRKESLLDVLAGLSAGKEPSRDQVSSFTVSFDEVSKWYAFSFAVDLILYAGFPPDLLSLLLTVAVLALVVAFFSQILGLSAFGTYYPILFALSLVTVGKGPSLLLLAAALVAGWAVRGFAKRVYLLHTAKKALFLSAYLVLAVAALAADRAMGLGIVDYAAFANAFVVFPVVVAAVVAERLFDEDFALWTRSGWATALEFFAVAGSAYLLAQWTGLRYFLLAYPEIIAAVLAATVLVGRFTGLQAVEYFRFLPLLKKRGEEE